MPPDDGTYIWARKINRNIRIMSMGSRMIIRKLGYERWKQLKDTGRRWIAEIVFSSLKRVLGEDLLSKKFKAQKIEAGLKVMLYNKFIGL